MYIDIHFNETHVLYSLQKRNIDKLTEECNAGFDLDDGPFCRALDEALAEFKVQCKAYYGGTFTGNHAHKCLQVMYVYA